MAGLFNDAQLDDANTFSKSTTHDFGELESRDNGHISFSKLSPLRYLFIHTISLPRLLNSLSPRIYLIFCLIDCPYPLLRSWFHNTNASPTSMVVSSSLGPPWPARPSHLQPFVHRPLKEISPWFNPFNELASIPSSLMLVAAGRPLTYIDRRLGCAQLRGYSPLPKFAQCSELLDCLNPDALCVVTYIAYHPMAPISARNYYHIDSPSQSEPFVERST